jgi:ubiquinone/menaquinone biosynthesis C-methylase UbiE
MAPHICPWWLGWMLDNPIRGFFHNPQSLLSPYVTKNMIALDIGSGSGFFTRSLARLVGLKGKVVAIDRQQPMLDRLSAKVRRARLSDRIVVVRAQNDDLGLAGTADFALAFWMLHEVRDTRRVLEQIFQHLKPGAKLFLVEPKFEVPPAFFREFLELAHNVGFKEIKRPRVAFSRAVLLAKPASNP